MGKTHRAKPYKERKPLPPTGGPMGDKRTKRQDRQSWRTEWEDDQAEQLAEAEALAEMEDM